MSLRDRNSSNPKKQEAIKNLQEAADLFSKEGDLVKSKQALKRIEQIQKEQF